MSSRTSKGVVWCAALALALGACRLDPGQAVAPHGEGTRDASQDTSPIDVVDPQLDASPMQPGSSDSGSMKIEASVDTGTTQCTSLATCVPPSGCTASEYAGHVYFFCTESLAWDVARTRCVEADTDLAIMEDAAENMFVSSALSASSWIGLNDRDTEGDYRWVDPLTSATAGSSINFTNWGATKPDNCLGGLFGEQDCVRLLADGTWDDSDCAGGCTEGTFAFVCESI